MRSILYVIGSLEIGGSEKHVLALARALSARGWQAIVFSIAGPGPLQADFRMAGVTVVELPERAKQRSDARRLFDFLRAVWRLFRTMRKTRPDIVHFFLPVSYLTGAPLALLARLPVRVMSRRSLNRYQLKHPAQAWMERRLHRTMSALLGNSQRVMGELAAEGAPPERLALIYNGIESSRIVAIQPRAQVRDRLQLTSGTLVLTIVANLIRYKGHLDLIEALSIANPDMPPKWRVLIVGRDDGVGADIHARAAARDIAQHVTMLGPRTDIADLLGAADIGLLCSHEEGFSNAILEGMAAGLPMIVTDVGGNREAVIDGETGIVVPPHSPSALAEAIIRLANNPDMRRRYGEAGRKRADDRFPVEACIARYELLYKALLEGKRPCDVADIGS